MSDLEQFVLKQVGIKHMVAPTKYSVLVDNCIVAPSSKGSEELFLRLILRSSHHSR